MKMRWTLTVGAGIGLAAAGLAWLLQWTGSLQRPELWMFDWRARAHARPADDRDARIRLVLIDNESLRWADRENDLPWPWPRDVYTYILDYCAQAGVKAFVFDALFVHRSAGGIVAHDQALGKSIARLPLFVTAVLPSPADGHDTAWPDDLPPPRFHAPDLFTWLHKWGDGDAVSFPTADLPIPEVLQLPTVLGHARGTPDPDDRFRRVPLLSVFDGHVLPSLALSTFLARPAVAGQAPAIEPFSLARDAMRVAGQTIPIDRQGRMILRFRRRQPDGQLYRAYSAKAIIQSALQLAEGQPPLVPPDDLRDAVVFFGASAPALYDLKSNPMQPKGSGVTLHATAYDNLVTGDIIRPAPAAAVALVTALMAMATAVFAAIGRRLREVAAAGVWLAVALGLGFVTYRGNLWWPMAWPGAAVALAWVGGLALNYATEGRQRRYLRRAFSQYVSPAVVDRITRDPAQLQLGGELRTLTIFFSDLEGFSSLAHDLSPVQITTLLNTYLSDMVSILFDEQGTLDKYEGDAIIAFWNAPVDQPDHALRACRAAVRCQRRLAARDAAYRALAGGRPLRMRVGLHTGPVVVGNMGSTERFDYTMLGDAANLASRLEGANKHLGTRVLVSEDTWRLVADKLTGRAMGPITVVGRETPLHVYELLEDEDPSSPRCVEYALALSEASTGRTDAALARLQRLKTDPACAALARYINSLLPQQRAEWDGVRRLSEK